MQEECSDFLTQDECLSYDFCQWVSDSPNGMNGMCVEFNNDGDDDWSCSDINNLYECYAMDCEWISGDMPGAGSCVEGDDEEDNDSECSSLSYEDCQYLDYCEWISDSDNPAVNGYCIDAEGENDDDGPPDCVLDCEGIENVSPEDDATYFCNWLLDVFPSGCAEDCEQDVLDDIEEFMIVCDECLSDNNCDGIFDDTNEDGCFEDGEWYCFGCELFINECEYYECTEDGWQGPFELDGCEDNNECSELNYPDCIATEGCEWIISNEWRYRRKS